MMGWKRKQNVNTLRNNFKYFQYLWFTLTVYVYCFQSEATQTSLSSGFLSFFSEKHSKHVENFCPGLICIELLRTAELSEGDMSDPTTKLF